MNDLSDFTYYEALKTSLPVSDFPIEEYVPILSANYGPANLGEIYDSEINLHPSYRGFGYFINEKRAEEGAPSALVFQGSYMNKSGYKFLRNSFSEYTYVHDYQNVIDFPYYCNIFHPDCVIFEVAEYTLTNSYFNYEAMKAIQYNPSLSATKNTRLPVNPSEENITVKEGKALSTITWHTDAKYKYVWLDADVAYDMKAVESGYEVTVKTENLPDLSNCLLYTTPEDLFDDESGNLLPSLTAENGALLLNEEALEPGFYIDPNTGERLFLPEYNYRGTSSFIDIDPTAPYYLATFHEGNGVTFAYNAILGAYYDKDGKYISGIYSSDEIQQGCYMFNGRRQMAALIGNALIDMLY